MSWEYIAAFIDGEGCIRVWEYNNTKYPSCRSIHKGVRGTIEFSQSQKQDEVMFVISEFLSAKGIIHSLYKTKWKSLCPMTIIKLGNKKEITKLLDSIIDFMVVKKKEAKNLYRFCIGKDYDYKKSK